MQFRNRSMPLPRPKGSAELIEARRRQAQRLLEESYSLNEAARLIGSGPNSVMCWRDARDSGGEEALKVRFSSGRPSTLTARQRKRIVKQLLRGAMANGFSTQLWNTSRVSVLIHQLCNVQFHRSHVARLLHELGFSCQKPERRALERDEQKIEEWKRKRWPQLKKRHAAGCPPRVCRRIRLHDDPAGAAHLGAGWADPHPTPLLQPRSHLRDRRPVGQSAPTSARGCTFACIRRIFLRTRRMTSSGTCCDTCAGTSSRYGTAPPFTIQNP
jgi:transposase